VRPLARDRSGIRRFLKVPYHIYAGDPNWVAPLLIDAAKVFSDANPFFEHARMQLWIAEAQGKPIGRIAGIIDDHFNQRHGPDTAIFGFFECVNRPEAARALFEAAARWAADQGMRHLLGPLNPTANDECGLLVKGFHSPPVLMMPYNPPYYPALLEGTGFRKAKDLLAFYINLERSPLDKLRRLAEVCRRRHPEITFRPVRRRTVPGDLALIKEVYNEAWEENWGFVPMTDAEIDFLAERLKPLLLEGFVWLAEDRGRPAAFMLALPDYNVAFRPMRGRVLSPGLFRALPYLLKLKHPKLARVLAFGVKKNYRNRGLEAAMLTEGLAVGLPLGFRAAEASWILEDNLPMRRIIETFGGTPYKVYRIYEKPIEHAAE